MNIRHPAPGHACPIIYLLQPPKPLELPGVEDVRTGRRQPEAACGGSRRRAFLVKMRRGQQEAACGAAFCDQQQQGACISGLKDRQLPYTSISSCAAVSPPCCLPWMGSLSSFASLCLRPPLCAAPAAATDAGPGPAASPLPPPAASAAPLPLISAPKWEKSRGASASGLGRRGLKAALACCDSGMSESSSAMPLTTRPLVCPPLLLPLVCYGDLPLPLQFVSTRLEPSGSAAVALCRPGGKAALPMGGSGGGCLDWGRRGNVSGGISDSRHHASWPSLAWQPQAHRKLMCYDRTPARMRNLYSQALLQQLKTAWNRHGRQIDR